MRLCYNVQECDMKVISSSLLRETEMDDLSKGKMCCLLSLGHSLGCVAEEYSLLCCDCDCFSHKGGAENGVINSLSAVATDIFQMSLIGPRLWKCEN